MPLPVYLLAVAVFAMGTSEFMLAGLLPHIAADLDVTVATAGLLTSGFAVGMVVGAPLMAAMTRAWPRRTALLGFLGLFLLAHVLGAVTGSYAVLFATRVVAAVANAGFLAVALTTTARLVAPDHKGRALGVLLGGITVATVAGVPGGTLLGTLLDWRASFWAVALLCLPAAWGVARGIEPDSARREPGPGTALRSELAQLRRPRLILAMTLGALVNAATFGGFTYPGVLVTDVAGLGELWVAVVLVLFGLGSFTGVTIAGRLSDRRPGLMLAVAGPLLLLGWIALGLLAERSTWLLALAFGLGALSFAVGSTLIARVLYQAAAATTMAGSYATAALNVGAAAGPALAGAALSGPAAELGPVWVSVVLIAVALSLSAVFRRALVSGAGRKRPVPKRTVRT